MKIFIFKTKMWKCCLVAMEFNWKILTYWFRSFQSHLVIAQIRLFKLCTVARRQPIIELMSQMQNQFQSINGSKDVDETIRMHGDGEIIDYETIERNYYLDCSFKHSDYCTNKYKTSSFSLIKFMTDLKCWREPIWLKNNILSFSKKILLVN